jgi:phosphoglycerate kinase
MAGLPAIPSIDDVEVTGRRVLLRVDINSPLDPDTRRITSEVRIDRSLPTIRDLSDRGARLVVIAHQGDTLDYHNVASLDQHAGLLAEKLGRPVGFVDDVAGPEARRRILEIGDGEILLLDNVRFLSEEMSTFERDVKLTPAEMAQTYLVRNLAPLFDLYVNDAFAAAHRAAPSMIAFQHLLPSAGGRLLEAEVTGLSRIIEDPARPAVFLLGGLKVSDGFSMMGRVLDDGLADRVLTAGVLGEIFLMADGADLGEATAGFIADRDLVRWTNTAAELLDRHRDAIELPTDLALLENGRRVEIAVSALPASSLALDIGEQTIAAYEQAVARAGTVFVNGPAGAYEQQGADLGTRRLWAALAAAPGVTAMGGGDTVASAGRFIDTDAIDFVSTAGGALIRYISGMPLPLFEAFRDTAG